MLDKQKMINKTNKIYRKVKIQKMLIDKLKAKRGKKFLKKVIINLKQSRNISKATSL